MTAKEPLRNCTKCGKRGRFGIRYSHLAVDHPDQKTQPRCALCRNIKTPENIRSAFDNARKVTAAESRVDTMTRAQMQREFKTRFPDDKGIKSNWYMRQRLLGKKP